MKSLIIYVVVLVFVNGVLCKSNQFWPRRQTSDKDGTDVVHTSIDPGNTNAGDSGNIPKRRIRLSSKLFSDRIHKSLIGADDPQDIPSMHKPALAVGTENLPDMVSISTSNGLAPYGARPLAAPMMTMGDRPEVGVRGLPALSQSDPVDEDTPDRTPDEGIHLRFSPGKMEIPEEFQSEVVVEVECPTCYNLAAITVSAAVLSTHLAVISPSQLNMTRTDDEDIYQATFNVTTIFLGVTYINFTIGYYDNQGDYIPNYHQVLYYLSVERTQSIIDIFFDYAMQVMLVVSTATFGAELDLGLMKKYFKRPVGVIIGLLCQYGIMPSLVLFFDYLVDIPMFIDYGLLAYASCPGGGASNIYTSLLGGEINLSITMTFMSTVASLAFMPMWMYTAGPYLSGTAAQIPFINIVTGLLMIIIPVFVGIAIKKFLPRFAVYFIKVLRPVSVVGVLFLMVAGFYINFYVIEIVIEQGWKVAVPSVFLPYVGITLAMLVALVCRQPWSRVKTIGIETGVQNMPLAVMMLRSSLQSPARQMASVGPVVAGLATPIPIVIAILIRFIYLRCTGVIVENEKEDHDDESMDGDLNENDGEYQMRRMSVLVKREIRRMSTLVRHERRASMMDADLVEGMTYPGVMYKQDGRPRTHTADTLLSEIASEGRSRAGTIDTMLDSDEDTMHVSNRMTRSDTMDADLSEVPETQRTFVTTDALPGIYRSRSNTTDTMLSDAPILSRMQGRHRSDTTESNNLEDSPATPRRSLDVPQDPSPSPSPKGILKDRKVARPRLSSRYSVDSHLAGEEGTTGTYRKTDDMSDISFSPIIYRRRIPQADCDSREQGLLGDHPANSTEHAPVESPSTFRRQKRAAALETLVNESPMLHQDGPEEDSTGATTRSTPQRTSSTSTESTDTGLGSFRSSLSSGRRRSLSLSSLDTISAYVETIGSESVLSTISVEDERRHQSLINSRRAAKTISASLDVEQSRTRRKTKKRIPRTDSGIAEEDFGEIPKSPKDNKSASKTLQRLLNKSLVRKNKDYTVTTKEQPPSLNHASGEYKKTASGKF